jgi:hypothetical protein
MALFNRLLAAVRQPKPKTYIESGSTKRAFFSERARARELLKKYETVYNQGGIITEAINAYPMFITANGWRLEGPDNLVETVESTLDEMDFDAVMWDGITDALVYGDAFQEAILNRAGTVSSVIPRLASSFEIRHDDHGKLKGYSQIVTTNGKEKKIPLKSQQIVHLQFWKLGGSMYGHSLIHRAYDEILRDTRTAEATATAIHRHGFKKYHIRVGKTGEIIPQDTLKDIDKEFKDLESKNDFVTPYDMEINNVDEGGLEKVDLYNDISLMRLAAALGVPEEVLGLRRGSTDATAVTRTETFFRKISAMQNRVSRCYNINVINRIVKPGTVKLIFNEVNPEDATKKATWISTIMKSSKDPFAVLPQEWVQSQFNIAVAEKAKGKAPRQDELTPGPGLILSANHAELIGHGIQRAIAKPASLNKHLGEPLYLVSDGLCHGIISLDAEEILDADEFQARASMHLMADDPVLKRKQRLFYYNVRILSVFSEPISCTTTDGARNFAKRVEFIES